jgi:hypothetical protein
MPRNTSTPTPAQKPARTSVSLGGRKAPRLPHERDESSRSTTEETDPQVGRAYADVKRGLVDTDKGPVLERTYDRVRNKPTKEDS